jgi:hypothetical protein
VGLVKLVNGCVRGKKEPIIAPNGSVCRYFEDSQFVVRISPSHKTAHSRRGERLFADCCS